MLNIGQPISRIARLQLGDVKTSEQEVLIRLGKETHRDSRTLASLLAELAREPRSRAVTAATRTPWLFSGKVVGLRLN